MTATVALPGVVTLAALRALLDHGVNLVTDGGRAPAPDVLVNIKLT